jgi:hypothetical protein
MLYGKEENKTGEADTTVTETPTTFYDEYKNTINSPEVKALSTDIANKKAEITTLQTEMLKIKTDLEKEYE